MKNKINFILIHLNFNLKVLLKDKFIGKSWNIEIDNWFWDKFLYFQNIFYILLNKKKSNHCWIKININDNK